MYTEILATATQLVDNRVLILNVIMLPAALFTAAVSDMPSMSRTTAKEPSEAIPVASLYQHGAQSPHVQPSASVTPQHAERIGLVFILIACKMQ